MKKIWSHHWKPYWQLFTSAVGWLLNEIPNISNWLLYAQNPLPLTNVLQQLIRVTGLKYGFCSPTDTRNTAKFVCMGPGWIFWTAARLHTSSMPFPFNKVMYFERKTCPAGEFACLRSSHEEDSCFSTVDGFSSWLTYGDVFVHLRRITSTPCITYLQLSFNNVNTFLCLDFENSEEQKPRLKPLSLGLLPNRSLTFHPTNSISSHHGDHTE